MKKVFCILYLATLFVIPGCGTKETKPQAGTVVRDTITGVPCCVYLPYNYARRAGEEVFPVLYLQHGMYGSENDWTQQGRLVESMDSLLALGEVTEMVVVMPDNFLGSVPPAERKALMARPNISPDGEPFDTSKGAAHWRKLTSEQEKSYEMSGYWEAHFPQFMAEAEQRYSISREPAHRALAGLSMGGFHTMHVSHHLPGQFSCIGLFSPAVIPTAPNEIYDHWEDEVRKTLAYEPVYWIGIGREDFLYDYVQSYRQWLEANNLEYTYYESQGGHTWSNWQDYICRFMKKIH